MKSKFTNTGWLEFQDFEFMSVPESRFPIPVIEWKNNHALGYNSPYKTCQCCKTPWSKIKDDSKVYLIHVNSTEYDINGEPYSVTSNKWICQECVISLLRIKKMKRLLKK